MRDFIQIISIILAAISLAVSIGCNASPVPADEPVTGRSPSTEASVPIAEKFMYPVGDGSRLTQARDAKDQWFNALDFGEENHLGEDWNKNSGGNTDCGEPVHAAANGVITYAGDAGPGWGNVVIVTHHLPDGSKVQTLYGHLLEIVRNGGEVNIGETIGTIGNANGKYLCHLHFEFREASSPMWDKAGLGYSTNHSGWLDPSDFIDRMANDAR